MRHLKAYTPMLFLCDLSSNGLSTGRRGPLMSVNSHADFLCPVPAVQIERFFPGSHDVFSIAGHFDYETTGPHSISCILILRTYDSPKHSMAFPLHPYAPLADTLAPENPMLSAWHSESQYSQGLPGNEEALASIDETRDSDSIRHPILETSFPGRHPVVGTMAPSSLWSDITGNEGRFSTQKISPTSNLSDVPNGSILDSMPPASSILSGMPRGSTSLQASPGSTSITRKSSSPDQDDRIANRTPDPTPKRSSRASGKRAKANSKTDRHDSHQASAEKDDNEDQTDKPTGRTQRYREKNKIAASKCRARKRQQLQNIESRCSHYSAVNSELRLQVQDLTGELNDLRAMALAHQDCGCRVAWYNSSQAQKLVLNAQASASFDRGRAESAAAC